MFPDFHQSRILVIGDIMLDSYWQGQTRRISPEAPVPVVHVNDQSWRVGGCGNVAINVTSLGASATLVSLIGNDPEGDQLQSLLAASEVVDHCVIDDQIPTTNKLRVMSRHQQLIRLDFEQRSESLDTSALMARYVAALPDVDMVILSDYGKGVLADPQPFIRAATEQGVSVLADPKTSDFSSFDGAFLLTPNQAEFEAVAGYCSSQPILERKARELLSRHNIEGLLITQGERGMTLVTAETTERFAAQAQEVYDVTGAGDTVIATLATGLASGMSLSDAIFLAGKAAAIVVGRVGTASVTQDDLLHNEQISSNKLSPVNRKLVDRAQLHRRLQEYRHLGKKIVFTNGCFDLLHIGHVKYLEQASALGDVMVVGVNSDDSVARLKGADRPINSSLDRCQLLAGLASVDLVVEFTEDTPEQLLSTLKPDYLVKGGDYEISEIAGRQYAGEVVLIDYIDGKSSSNIVSRILQKN